MKAILADKKLLIIVAVSTKKRDRKTKNRKINEENQALKSDKKDRVNRS